jgi:hypothetical protein
MQFTRPPNVIEFPLELDDPIANQPAIKLDLAFTWTAKEAKTAALALKMRPGPNQAAALIAECCKLDLQYAFMRARTLAENLENETGAIDNFGLPFALQIALLHRRHRRVDHHKIDTMQLDFPFETLQMAGAEQGRRPDDPERYDLAVLHIKRDRRGQSDGFLQERNRGAQTVAGLRRALPVRVEH